MLTPSARSANVEAHWLITSSLAPAQTMMSIATRNAGVRSNAPSRMPPPSPPTTGAKGARTNSAAAPTGTITQHSGSTCHALRPITNSNSVEPSTVATCPQQ